MSQSYNTRTETIDPMAYRSQVNETSAPLLNQYRYENPTNFAQKWGLHPGIALLTLVVDSMLFGGEVASMGAIIPISIAVSFVMGLITFLWQRKFYGDDDEAALIKALTLTLLTAIPTALPAFLYVPMGLVGLFRPKES